MAPMFGQWRQAMMAPQPMSTPKGLVRNEQGGWMMPGGPAPFQPKPLAPPPPPAQQMQAPMPGQVMTALLGMGGPGLTYGSTPVPPMFGLGGAFGPGGDGGHGGSASGLGVSAGYGGVAGGAGGIVGGWGGLDF